MHGCRRPGLPDRAPGPVRADDYQPCRHGRGPGGVPAPGARDGAALGSSRRRSAPRGSSIEFYDSVLALGAPSARAQDWIRLIMVPGMGHCSGGEGPDTFDKINLIERWVERGEAPSRVIATHSTAGTIDRTRPLCRYPEVARYDGAGSIDDASHFSCRAPRCNRMGPEGRS